MAEYRPKLGFEIDTERVRLSNPARPLTLHLATENVTNK